MKKLFFGLVLLSCVAGTACGESTKTVFNPFTGKLDYITSTLGSTSTWTAAQTFLSSVTFAASLSPVTVNSSADGSGQPSGTFDTGALGGIFTITSDSNTIFSFIKGSCNITDTSAPFSGQIGHVPCILGLVADQDNSNTSSISVEGRLNAKGSAFQYIGVQGHADHYDDGLIAKDTSTVIGLDSVTETFATTAGNVGESSGGVVGLLIRQPFGQGAVNQTFAMIGASTYPYVMAGQVLIEPYTGVGFGVPWTTWPSIPSTANLLVNSNSNTLPGVFFESGNTASYFWMAIGRTGEDADIIVPSATNNFMVGTQAGDLLLRATNATNKIVMGTGSGQAAFYVNSSSVAVNGGFVLQQKTVLQFGAATPDGTGEFFGCSNCTALMMCVSTGTIVGSWSSPVAKTTACN